MELSWTGCLSIQFSYVILQLYSIFHQLLITLTKRPRNALDDLTLWYHNVSEFSCCVKWFFKKCLLFKSKNPKVGKQSYIFIVSQVYLGSSAKLENSNIYSNHKVETDDIHFEVLDYEKQISLGPKLEQKTKVFMAS